MRSTCCILILAAACTASQTDPGDEAHDTGDEAHGSPPVMPTSPTDLLREWSGCMSLGDFQAASMAPAWSTLANQRQCATCHDQGGSFVAPADEQRFFDAITQHSAHLLTYFAVEPTLDMIIANDDHLTTVSTAKAPFAPHPSFGANAALSALDQFYNLTLVRKLAATCDPPRLID